LPATRTSGGSSVAHLSWAFQQRVRKRQPLGGSIGLGTSPTRRMRSFGAMPRATLMSGAAESRAWV
jgi:hypothetical protein